MNQDLALVAGLCFVLGALIGLSIPRKPSKRVTYWGYYHD